MQPMLESVTVAVPLPVCEAVIVWVSTAKLAVSVSSCVALKVQGLVVPLQEFEVPPQLARWLPVLWVALSVTLSP